MTDRIDALRAAVNADPGNAALAGLLADLLFEADRSDEAVPLLTRLMRDGQLAGVDAVRLAEASLHAGQLEVAAEAIASARTSGVVDGLGSLEQRLHEAMAQVAAQAASTAATPTGQPGSSEFAGVESHTTFADVGGLDDLKKVLHRLIIMPFVRPDLYAKYNKRAGGGVLLYGPPGCGKTLMAKAMAGECGLPFFSVEIADVVSRWQGQAEVNLAGIFERARAMVPVVLFIDEIDAIGFARHRAQGEMTRGMTNTLLQQLDGIGKSTDGMLVLSASNAPWDLDSALLRPGRFDRQVFVPPPDDQARRAIWSILLRDTETAGVDIAALARATELFTGADIRAVIETALDRVIDEVLESGDERPVRADDLLAAVSAVRPSALDWLARARDYVEFSNSTGRWSDVEKYLSQRSVKRRLAGG